MGGIKISASILALMAVLFVGRCVADPAPAPTADVGGNSDSRLLQKVTYRANEQRVKTILADLSKMTGVTLTAGQSLDDWQVRDRKMIISVKDVPLVNLMNSMARVMKFTWSKDKHEPPGYRLYAVQKFLAEAQAREEQQEAQCRKQCLEALDKIADSRTLSETELEKLKQDNPYSYVMRVNGMAPALDRLFRAVPSVKEALVAGEEAAIRGMDLSPEGSEALARLIGVSNTWSLKLDPARKGVLPDDFRSRLEGITLRVNWGTHLVKDSLRRWRLGRICGGWGDSEYDALDFELNDPDSKLAGVIGNYFLHRMAGGEFTEQVKKDLTAGYRREQMAEWQKMDTGESQLEHPEDDPALSKRTSLKTENRAEFTDLLWALSESAELNIVSDYFFKPRGQAKIPAEETSAQKLIDEITRGYRYNWDKPRTIVEFWSRDWFTYRKQLIPEVWVEAWRKTLKETRTLDIEDLMGLANLTEDQFKANIACDKDFQGSNIEGTMEFHRELLRTCSLLDKLQWERVMSSSGLALSELSAEQLAHFNKFTASKAKNLRDLAPSLLTLRGELLSIGDYRFTFTIQDVPEPVQFWFPTIRYRWIDEMTPTPGHNPPSGAAQSPRP
ncbi:MAG: hypothetical protein Q7T82_06840 [Armatimonadota bacterium]|nr:hypothetical protein [Armatimonadota bacterium]